MSRASDSAQARAWVDSGRAIPLQAHIPGGHITYEFIGGTYDGVKIRLYPPFTRWVTLDGAEHYCLGPPKNGRSKRLTYRLLEDGDGDHQNAAADRQAAHPEGPHEPGPPLAGEGGA
ncbi:MAG: hypothetical protein ABWZ99_18370 [Ilumatobacteraceae bacterium]